MSNYSSSKNFKNGYPTPGPQNPSLDHILNHIYFTSNEEWKKIREENTYDYVVVGTGFCAYAFIERVLKNKPAAKILVLERGGFHLPEHFQNLPLAYQGLLGGMSETFPWTLDSGTANKDTTGGDYIKAQHGMLPFFGGRSTTWSAWCPKPDKEAGELDWWNEKIVEKLINKKYLDSAEELLNVISVDKLVGKSAAYDQLQKKVSDHFKTFQKKTELKNFSRSMSAPLAANGEESSEDFHKFSSPEKILELKMMLDADKSNKGTLDIVTLCTVNKIINDGSTAYALDTSRGIVNLNKAQLILAMGTLPPTTLVRNSFPTLNKVGTRFTSHFITSVVARIKKDDFAPYTKQPLNDIQGATTPDSNKLQFAAMYVGGAEKSLKKDRQIGQFHIQMTFIEQEKTKIKTEGYKNRLTALKHMPDVVATASEEQLKGGEEYITIVCAVLGELDYKNNQNHFVANPNLVDSDITTNSLLSVYANGNDLKVWDAMDQFTFDVLEELLYDKEGKEKKGVEYWINGKYGKKPEGDTPKEILKKMREYIRVDSMVHEASTMWIDKVDRDGVVGPDYRLIIDAEKSVENVYITGGSLWPSGGSWNPTLTMVAMTQDLADQLSKK